MPPLAKERHFEILLGVTALVEERGEIPLPEAAAAVGVDVDDLRRLLEPLLYLEFKVSGDYIMDASHEFFLAPETDILRLEDHGKHWLRDLRSTPPDNDSALRLLISGTMYQSSERTSPALSSALDKLSQHVVAELLLPTTPPRWLGVVQDACRRMRSLRMDYLGFGKDMAAEREVLPWKLYSRWDQWYFDGPEVGNTTVKHWRVERILHAEVGTIDFDPPPDIEVPDFFDLEHLQRTFTVIAPQSVLDALPQPCQVENMATEPDHRVRATVSVAGDHKLDHVLLCLGSNAEVVDSEIAERRREWAGRLLELIA